MADENPIATCTAHSKATGLRCKQRPIPGATVCHWHGGGAPQVQQAARERLFAMANPALAQLLRICRKGEDDDVRLRAARDILDRIGLAATAKTAVELTGKDGNAIEFSTREALASRIASVAARISAGSTNRGDDGDGSA